MKYIVELETGVWIAPWDGDPGRTLVRESAKQFRTESAATHALARARKWRPFTSAKMSRAEQHGAEAPPHFDYEIPESAQPRTAHPEPAATSTQTESRHEN